MSTVQCPFCKNVVSSTDNYCNNPSCDCHSSKWGSNKIHVMHSDGRVADVKTMNGLVRAYESGYTRVHLPKTTVSGYTSVTVGYTPIVVGYTPTVVRYTPTVVRYTPINVVIFRP